MSVQASWSVRVGEKSVRVDRKCERCAVKRATVLSAGAMCKDCFLLLLRKHFVERVSGPCGLSKYERVVVGFDGSAFSSTLLELLSPSMTLDYLPGFPVAPCDVSGSSMSPEESQARDLFLLDHVEEYDEKFPFCDPLKYVSLSTVDASGFTASAAKNQSCGLELALMKASRRYLKGLPLRGVIVHVDCSNVTPSLTVTGSLGGQKLHFLDNLTAIHEPTVRYISRKQETGSEPSCATYSKSLSSLLAHDVIPVLCIPVELVVRTGHSIEEKRTALISALKLLSQSARAETLKHLTKRVLAATAQSLSVKSVLVAETLRGVVSGVVRRLCHGVGGAVSSSVGIQTVFPVTVIMRTLKAVLENDVQTPELVHFIRPFYDIPAKNINIFAIFEKLASIAPMNISRDRQDVYSLCSSFIAAAEQQNETSAYNVVRTAQKVIPAHSLRAGAPDSIQKYILEDGDEEEEPSCGVVEKAVSASDNSNNNSNNTLLSVTENNLCHICGDVVVPSPTVSQAQIELLNGLKDLSRGVALTHPADVKLCEGCEDTYRYSLLPSLLSHIQ